MEQQSSKSNKIMAKVWEKLGFGMRGKLVIIFVLVKVIPLILLCLLAWYQFTVLGDTLKKIAVEDTSAALNDSAVENIERMTTDTAEEVADFLYDRDADIRYLSQIEPSEEEYTEFINSKLSRVVEGGKWELSETKDSWVEVDKEKNTAKDIKSSNTENEDEEGFHYRKPENYPYKNIPLYDEVTFIDLDGNEKIKVTTDKSPKKNYPINPAKKNVSNRKNTYVKAETYFPKLKNLKADDIYVSDVIGAYVGSNYIGMYAPNAIKEAEKELPYKIDYKPEEQAYAGQENPNGQRFEGIVRWVKPVTDSSGKKIGYVSFALNHDHIMEFVDHKTPMNERYTQVPSAFDGNYAFIWDYKCRNICHPRHHSITGFDPDTGDPQIPWLEESIYQGWQKSGDKFWYDYAKTLPNFDHQSREKKPAIELTQRGLVGLDGRYLNNAPQCTGWMDLTQDGGSGSFYILWSGLYKLTTAASIPYYTGDYGPSEDNDFSKRGFGFVTIGAGLEDFTKPAKVMEQNLTGAVEDNMSDTTMQLILTTFILILLVVLIAIWMASFLTGNIHHLINGISRFRSGERQFRFNSDATDEFGTLADSFDDMADSIVDSVKNSLSITDMDLKIIYMNNKGLEFTRKTLDEAVGLPYFTTSVYPENSKYDPILALKEGREAETYYIEHNQTYIKGTADYLLDKDGKRIGYMIVSNDVTKMVEEQMQIEEQRTLLSSIFTESPDLMWYTDAKSKFMTVNPRFASISGMKPKDFVGKKANDVFDHELANKFTYIVNKAFDSKELLYNEETIEFADGHKETLEFVLSPIFDSNGNAVGLLGFGRNVTERVTIENELRNTQSELEQAVHDANIANEHKGDFLARMSHEIRTPMNAIIGITNILQKRLNAATGELSEREEIIDNIDKIENSSQHLLGLLNDILDISKIEAGKIELTEEKMELSKLATTVSNIIKPRCEEKNIDFVAEFDDFDHTTFLSDPLRLRQVLINLLGNAVKFTPECGSIVFGIHNLKRENDKTLVEFVVKDSGIGISKEDSENIFKPFELGKSQVQRQKGGTGLGLAISRSMVNLFGGDIELESEQGKGSEFRFQIWLKEVESDTIDEEVISNTTGILKGKKILIVDDVEINRIIVKSMLEDTGVETEEAKDGLEAIARIDESEEYEYDLILMDIQMPNMDGYEASDKIRSMDRDDAEQIPIIALTANAFKEDINDALEHGMNAHLAKPLESDDLIEMLYKYMIGRNS